MRQCRPGQSECCFVGKAACVMGRGGSVAPWRQIPFDGINAANWTQGRSDQWSARPASHWTRTPRMSAAVAWLWL